MTLSALRTTVLQFKKGLLSGKPSDNKCFVVCCPLQGFLEICGVHTRIVEGHFEGQHHFWLETPNGTVIDPTQDQFASPLFPMKKVYIGERGVRYVET